MAELLPPTGLSIESFVRDNFLEWHASDNAAVVGYNVYVSATPGGGQSRFLRLNNTVITTPNRTESVIQDESSDEVETILDSDSAEQTVITRRIVNKVPVFRFRHQLVDINSTLFYVITSVDASGAESGFSTELTGTTTRIDSAVANVPPREFGDIVNGFIDTLIRRNPEMDLKPGTVVRDLVIDPQAFEMEKMWFFLNFIDKSTSMLSLRAIDDQNDDSISDPVSQSDFKQRLRAALSLTSDDDAQTVIDFAMEKLATNVRVFRKGATLAQGEVVFYTATRPTGDLEISVGTAVWTDSSETGSVINFSTTSSVVVQDSDMDMHFNAAKGRYEFKAPIVADAFGRAGNVSVGAIVNSNVGQFSVTNHLPTFGGDVAESNSLFSERAVLKMSSLDVGTTKGYRRVVIEQPGVRDAFVADAGHPLMQRDFIRHVSPDGTVKSEHIFGKVDVWVRGGESVIFEDRIGFLYKKVDGEQFDIAERISAFVIETTNPDVTEDTPIFEVDSITRRRSGFPDADYILDNLIIEDGGRRLRIDTSDATNVGIGLEDGDTILVTYQFRGSDPIVLLSQPATSIISVEGLNSGTLDEGTHYEFLRKSDFLLEGRGVLDRAGIQLKFDSQSGKPIGTIEDFFERTGNRDGIILTGDFRELSKRGILSGSVAVQTIPTDSSDPVTLELNRNYILETDDSSGITTIKLVGSDSRFPPGQRYDVSYKHGEEIVIRYRSNNMIGRIQNLIDQTRHEAADVLVKAARPVDIDVIFSFKVSSGIDALDTKQSVSDAVRTFVASRRMGETVFESDLIFRVQQVDGVKHVVLPMSRLARIDGSYETNEEILSDWSEVIVDAQTGTGFWQTPQNALMNNTLGTSAEPNEFWGLRESGTALKLVDGLTALVADKGTFFIDATGTVFVNPKSVDEVGNPLNDPDPNNNEYAATYRISGESGSQDILIQENEYPRLADLIIEVLED